MRGSKDSRVVKVFWLLRVVVKSNRSSRDSRVSRLLRAVGIRDIVAFISC